ncbi:F-BAR domain only protein 1 [Ilyodon furcidens]|uniref:F-BAR domain only protein 1 n=1 Tax=Ilyodon furcidens TaxID=33524 RepID=A0ABV0SUS5_9TELE
MVSDSDFDDEEPKKFHIQIRPVASSSRSNSVAAEKELKATVGTLTLPPNRGTRQQMPVKRHLSSKFNSFTFSSLPFLK